MARMFARVGVGVLFLGLPGISLAYDSPRNEFECYNGEDVCPIDDAANKGCGGVAANKVTCGAGYAVQRTVSAYGCGYTDQLIDLTNGQISGQTRDGAGTYKLNWSCLIALGTPDPNAPVRGDDFGPEVLTLSGRIDQCPLGTGCRDSPSPIGLWEAYVQVLEL